MTEVKVRKLQGTVLSIEKIDEKKKDEEGDVLSLIHI